MNFQLKWPNNYNLNTKSSYISTLTGSDKSQPSINDTGSNIIVIMGGKFNFHFEYKLEWNCRKPILKNNFIAKMIDLIESFWVYSISQIRNLLTHFNVKALELGSLWIVRP